MIRCRTLCTIAFKKQICQLYMQICDILTNPSKIFYYMQSHKGKIQIHFFFFLGDKIDPYLIFLLGEPRLKVQLFPFSFWSLLHLLLGASWIACVRLYTAQPKPLASDSFMILSLLHELMNILYSGPGGKTTVSLAKQWSNWSTNLLFY